MRKKCRIWWPKKLSLAEHSNCGVLFGWFVCHSSASLDVVVAFVSDYGSVSNCQARLQNVLHDINEKMPATLQDKATFTLLGHYDGCLNANGESYEITEDEDGPSKIEAKGRPFRDSSLSCGCHGIDGLLDLRQDSIGSYQIHMMYDSSKHIGGELHSISRLHHIHWNGEIVYQCDVHVIAYETPVFGSHHYMQSFWSSSPQAKASLKKPKWVDELHQRQPVSDMEIVILSINCASAVEIAYKRCMQLDTAQNFSIGFMIFSFTWKLLAAILASLSTLYYGFIQFVYLFSNFSLIAWVHIASGWILKNTWINIRIRSSQISYWPILLQERDMRSMSCVEHAERAALQRHSMWSALVIDIVLGNLIGLGLLFHTESVCSWIFNLAKEFTNGILRSGCVWLMGVPAGFKLNTELAGVLGMLSLNVIQIWSTFWVLMAFYIFYFIKALAILGIAFGTTIPAALFIDVITFATLHVSALHQAITLLYSHQIEALAALWRLFRGRKWNPLRQRLDSYGYTVKQHIVGSLLFTPLLLLLPTTSVFYIFFSIMSTTINSICMLIEIAISVIHATPYAKIILWLMRRSRFPSGIWFDIEHCQDNIHYSSKSVCFGKTGIQPKVSRGENDTIKRKSSLLISTLRSNFLSFGQILLPHYRTVFSGISGSSLAASAHGLLTGKRMPSNLGLSLPPTMPWMHMPCEEYWRLCRNTIISSVIPSLANDFSR